MRINYLLLTLIFTIQFMVSFGCVHSTQPDDRGKGVAAIKISVEDLPIFKKQSRSVILTVTAADMQPLIQHLTITDTSSETTIGGIAPGNARVFAIAVFDSLDTLQYSGLATADIIADKTVHITIALMRVPVPTEGLVASYPFNGNAMDESGGGNDATVNGSLALTNRFGDTGNGYAFNGVSDYIVCKNFWFTAAPAQFTLSLWFQGSSAEIKGAQNMAFHGAPAEFQMSLRGDTVCAGIHISRSPDQWQSLRYKIEAFDGWHHAVIVYSLGSAFSLYVDTICVAKINAPPAIIPALVNCKCGFGRYLCGDSNIENLKGDLDDIRIYNRALSESEIRRLFHEDGWMGNSVL